MSSSKLFCTFYIIMKCCLDNNFSDTDKFLSFLTMRYTVHTIWGVFFGKKQFSILYVYVVLYVSTSYTVLLFHSSLYCYEKVGACIFWTPRFCLLLYYCCKLHPCFAKYLSTPSSTVANTSSMLSV